MVRRKMEDVNPDMPPKYRRVVPIELDATAADGWSAKADIEESLARAQIDSRGLPPLPRITEALMAYSEIKAPLAARYVADEAGGQPRRQHHLLQQARQGRGRHRRRAG